MRWGLSLHSGWRLAGLFLVLLSLLLIGCQPATIPPATPSSIQLFVEPNDGRVPLLSLLQEARTRVDMTIYLLSDERMAQALEDAATRKVRVRVLLEGHPFGGGETNRRMAERLRAAGVEVRFASPAFRYTHEKSLIVDEDIGVIMTMNLTPSSFKRNREYGVIFKHKPWVEEMAAVFQADWERRTPRFPSPPNLVWSPINARETIVGLLNDAQIRLDLEEQDLQDAQIMRALVDALKRGVKVRLIRPTPREGEALEWANVRQLVRLGAEVAFLDHPYVHAKVIVVDGKKALIGSINLTMTSLDLNRELGVVITDRSVLSRLMQQMQDDWEEATPVSAAAPTPDGVVLPEDAARYAGQVVTVQGRVLRTYDSGKVTFLDMTSQRDGFSVVIFASNYRKFPKPPATYYDGKLIQVRGRVKLYKGAPEIIVDDPGNINILR